MEAGPCSIGDWGAPLVKLADETAAGSKDDIIVGLASYGNPGCGEHDPSFVYTQVVSHYEWIHRTICFESASPPYGCELAYTATPSSSPSIAPYDPTNFFTVLSDTTSGRGTIRCGGSLLSPNLVLTATSCLSGGSASSMVARVGYESDERTYAVRNVSYIIEHPGSKGQGEHYPNDIAIVVLTEPVYNVSTVVSNGVRSIELAI
jgi:secreted trypsin-like serine protease